MNTQVIITVTSLEGQPTLTLPGSLSADELRTIVRNRFGLKTDGNSPGIPHSFCGSLVPPPVQKPFPSTISMLCQRGHNRIV